MCRYIKALHFEQARPEQAEETSGEYLDKQRRGTKNGTESSRSAPDLTLI